MPTHSDHPRRREIDIDSLPEPARGFDVTYAVTIGRVDLDDCGSMNPYTAAMAIIGTHCRDGVYQFPGPHEDTWVTVTVDGIE